MAVFKKLCLEDLSGVSRYQLLIEAIVPRPIAFVGTVSVDGVRNLSPFSFFNVFSVSPPVFGFSPTLSSQTGKKKDTTNNILQTKEFTVSVVTYDIVHKSNVSACPYEASIDEFVKASLTPYPSSMITPPGVAESPVIFECRLRDIISFGETPGSGQLVLGDVLCVHLREDVDVESSPDESYGHFIHQKDLDIMGRLGKDWWLRSSEGLMTLPSSKHCGIGFDALPKALRESPFLSAYHLSRFALMNDIPKIIEWPRDLHETYNKASSDARHKLCAQAIDQDDMESAWLIACTMASDGSCIVR